MTLGKWDRIGQELYFASGNVLYKTSTRSRRIVDTCARSFQLTDMRTQYC